MKGTEMNKRQLTIAYRACLIFGFGLFGTTVLGGHGWATVAGWAVVAILFALLTYFTTNEGADE